MDDIQLPSPVSNTGTEIKNSFILFGRMKVTYEGRASSSLQEGQYLLIRKPDGSVSVHAGDLTTPRNYQPAGSRMYQSGWQLTVMSKKETMVIEVIDIINIHRPKDWSTHKLAMIRTEKQLRDNMAANIGLYVPDIVEVKKEVLTEHGPIDMVAIDVGGTHHVFEVKRHRISVSAAIQLRKYLDALHRAGHRTIGYLAAPAIIPNAQKYCERHGYRYIPVQHQESV